MRCAFPQLADKDLTSHLAVALPAPLGIGQEQPDGFPLIGISTRQAVRGVGRRLWEAMRAITVDMIECR
jgi:hypothetical protein